MTYMKVSEAAEKWGITARRVRVLCEQGRIAGVERKGNLNIKFADRRKYYDAFDEFAKNGSSEAMTVLVGEAVVSRLREMLDAIKS